MATTVSRLEANVSADTSQAQHDLKDLEQAAKDSGGGFDSLAESAGDMAGKLAGALGAVGIIGGSIASALDTEQISDKLAAQLGATPAQAKQYGDAAANLYKGAWGESMGEVSAAIGSVVTSIGGMRDATQADVEAMTATAMNFATAMDVDVSDAAKSAGLLVKNGLAADGTAGFDLLTAAAQAAGPAMTEPLLEAVNEYGTNFAAMGYSGKEAMGILVEASKGGEIALDKAGDAMKEFSILATDGNANTAAAYKAIGLNGEDMARKLAGGGPAAHEAMAQIVKGLQGIQDPAAKANAAIAFFGSPLEDIGVTKVPEFLAAMSQTGDSLGEVGGAAERMGATLNDNAAANLESFRRQVTMGITGALGGVLLPALQGVASTLATGFGPAWGVAAGILGNTVLPPLKAVAGFLGDHQTILGVVAALITSVFVPALVAWGVQSAVAAAKSVAAWVASTASASAGALAQVLSTARVVAGWVLMGTQSLLQAARMAAAWLIAMGPIALVIAAVVGLVALIITHWDDVKRITAAVWDAVVGFVTGAWDKIKAAVSAVIDWLKGFLTGAWDVIKGAASAAWDAIKAVITGVFDAIKAAITMYVDAWKAVLSAAWDAIKAVASAAWDAIKAVVGAVLGAVKAIIDREVQGIKNIWNGLSAIADKAREWFGKVLSAITEKLGDAVNFVKGIPGKIIAALGDVGGMLFDSGKAIIKGLINGILNMGDAVKDAVGGVLKKARNLLPFSPAKEGPFSGKGWTLYSGQSIGKALAQGLTDTTSAVHGAALGLAQAAYVDPPALSVGSAAAEGAGRAQRLSVDALGVQAPSASVSLTFTTYNPVAEPQSVTTNKALARAAALSLV